MSRLPASDRLSHAESEIRYLTGQINYHDAEASRLRKVRERHKAARDRALATIEREAAAQLYESRNEN